VREKTKIEELAIDAEDMQTILGVKVSADKQVAQDGAGKLRIGRDWACYVARPGPECALFVLPEIPSSSGPGRQGAGGQDPRGG